MTKPEAKAEFIDPMLLLRTDKLPEGDGWQYELDGYRAIAFKTRRPGPNAGPVSLSVVPSTPKRQTPIIYCRHP
jgi:hypothetical protein